ncbi:Lactase-phlorizin hydrolase [Folsomia candida]|uniref:Lactase-phlorizin hydrolase n=1 Tax=Folsomia candida TaxID=158441 RepID=A0A226DKL9_FOLCA|nr:Lactase-phlorizin hydrolase [Folsomia candida]
MSEKLQAYFQNDDTKIPPETYEPGTLCVIENYDGIFRAKILQILTRTEPQYPKSLRVLCIDSGFFGILHPEKVYLMPQEFRNIPQLSVELVLANLQSLESGVSYSGAEISRAVDATVDRILLGRVLFSMVDTVWVNPLVDVQKDYADVQTQSSVRLDLIRIRCAKENDTHMIKLFKLGRDTGFTCPELEALENSPIKDVVYMSQFFGYGEKFEWAFVPTSTPENPKSFAMWSTFTRNPYCIFATQTKFEKLLDAVNTELDACIKGHISGRCSQYNKQFKTWYQSGLMVAVKDRITERWIREETKHCVHNVIKAHARTYRLYDKVFRPIQGGKIGMGLISYWVESRDSRNHNHKILAETALQIQWGSFAHPIVFGKYPAGYNEAIYTLNKKLGLSSPPLEFTLAESAEIRGT